MEGGLKWCIPSIRWRPRLGPPLRAAAGSSPTTRRLLSWSIVWRIIAVHIFWWWCSSGWWRSAFVTRGLRPAVWRSWSFTSRSWSPASWTWTPTIHRWTTPRSAFISTSAIFFHSDIRCLTLHPQPTAWTMVKAKYETTHSLSVQIHK